MFLSDDPLEPHRFALPALVVQAGVHVLIWCDDDLDQGPEHAPFKLSKDGDSIYLSTETATIDGLLFGPLGTDRVKARSSDGAPEWVDCDRATPGEPNRCAATEPLYLPWSGTGG